MKKNPEKIAARVDELTRNLPPYWSDVEEKHKRQAIEDLGAEIPEKFKPVVGEFYCNKCGFRCEIVITKSVLSAPPCWCPNGMFAPKYSGEEDLQITLKIEDD